MAVDLRVLDKATLKEMRDEVNSKIRAARKSKKSTKTLEKEKAAILAELNSR